MDIAAGYARIPCGRFTTAAPGLRQRGPRRRAAARARIVEPGDADYPRLWRLVNQVNHGRYDGYQELTARPIALVLLAPAAAEH